MRLERSGALSFCHGNETKREMRSRTTRTRRQDHQSKPLPLKCASEPASRAATEVTAAKPEPTRSLHPRARLPCRVVSLDDVAQHYAH